jgi:Lipase (class 2)
MSYGSLCTSGSTLVVAAVITVLTSGTAMALPPPPSSPSPLGDGMSLVQELLPAPKLPDSAFAPVDRPGPELSVPQPQLDQALSCTQDAVHANREVVLFVPGTGLTPRENYSWNWFRALDKLGRPYCSVTLPNHAMSDTQVSAEYVVNAIRKVHAMSRRKVQILGYSEGGTEPRFALRFWPDLRGMVDDYITFAGTNHGTLQANALCATGCAPAVSQQRLNSRYTQAINSHQETFPGISYTQIYTRTDEVVQPNLDNHGSTSLHGGGGDITNISTQDVCPTTPNEHNSVGTYDPVAYAIATDALDHPGPANPARISRSVCGELFMPGVDPVTFPTSYADLVLTAAEYIALYPKVFAEPPLKPYVLAHPVDRCSVSCH